MTWKRRGGLKLIIAPNGGDACAPSRAPRKYSRQESVESARARFGEDFYHAAFSNCEQFVAWCITGKTRSMQADLLFGLTGGPWGLLLSRSGPVPISEDRKIGPIQRQRDERGVK
jgi:Lecithin retinol acyltransferase